MTDDQALAEPSPAPTASPPRRLSRSRLTLGALVAYAVVLLAAITVTGRPVSPTAGGTLVFEDDFERTAVGDKYRQGEPDLGWKAGTWRIEAGHLRAEKIHNAALWLKTPLPERVRIEFTTRALAPDGDVKAEVFGDGRNHQSGYVLINGGWKNSVNAIARQDEHGEERKEDRRCPAGAGRRMCVEPDVDYQWAIERHDGEVRWFLDGALFLTFPDAHPIDGRFFAFNNWEAPVLFDDLRIYDLGQ